MIVFEIQCSYMFRHVLQPSSGSSQTQLKEENTVVTVVTTIMMLPLYDNL
jgi:hypothetical protein